MPRNTAARKHLYQILVIICYSRNHIPYRVDILASMTRFLSDDEQVQLGTNLNSAKITIKATIR